MGFIILRALSFNFAREKSSGDEWWQQSKNSMNVFNVTELYFENCSDGIFYMCFTSTVKTEAFPDNFY